MPVRLGSEPFASLTKVFVLSFSSWKLPTDCVLQAIGLILILNFRAQNELPAEDDSWELESVAFSSAFGIGACVEI
jgi:hypothetical protein